MLIVQCSMMFEELGLNKIIVDQDLGVVLTWTLEQISLHSLQAFSLTSVTSIRSSFTSNTKCLSLSREICFSISHRNVPSLISPKVLLVVWQDEFSQVPSKKNRVQCSCKEEKLCYPLQLSKTFPIRSIASC